MTEIIDATALAADVKMVVEQERRALAAEISAKWREGLSHRDWLLDGSPIRGPVMLARFANLDWAKAWIDLGPSIAGNLGPYWHVPLQEGDTVHRLYPKVLQSKWVLLILHACHEIRNRSHD